MRNLTIKREKRFVACLMKMQVYVSDPQSTEIYINNMPCRKLGTLKNGEEKTFVIGNEDADIFVIADKLSKNFCNDVYHICAGEEDIFLSGRNRYNPATGNAFRFDGVTDETVLKNRKKGTRIGIIVLCIAALVGGIIGWFGGSGIPHDKTFSDGNFSITLTDEFEQIDLEENNLTDYYACFGTNYMSVFISKEPFSLSEGFGDLTIEEYRDLVLKNNDFDSSPTIQNHEGLTCFDYNTVNDSGDDSYYFTSVYKSDDAFWIVGFATFAENEEIYGEDIIEWAKSVKFTEE